MNPISLDAIKLLLDMQALSSKEEDKSKFQKMIDSLVFIMEKDIEQAFQKYSTVKLM